LIFRRIFAIIALYLCFTSAFAQQGGVSVLDKGQNDTLSVSDMPMTYSKTDVAGVSKELRFAPDPGKAVWYSALLPGLGQIYNRKYWKLPLVYGGFAGLTYALTWNSQYLKDYSNAYQDITDNLATTNRFLDILPLSYVKRYQSGEITQDRLTTILKNRRDYFRRNRDLTVISMVGLYFVTMIDAYVDAQLFQFDISPDLSLKLNPSLIKSTNQNDRSLKLGLQCSIKF